MCVASSGLKETAEQLVKKKLEEKDELTPWEEFLEKKKERRKQKKCPNQQVSRSDGSERPNVFINTKSVVYPACVCLPPGGGRGQTQ